MFTLEHKNIQLLDLLKANRLIFFIPFLNPGVLPVLTEASWPILHRCPQRWCETSDKIALKTREWATLNAVPLRPLACALHTMQWDQRPYHNNTVSEVPPKLPVSQAPSIRPSPSKNQPLFWILLFSYRSSFSLHWTVLKLLHAPLKEDAGNSEMWAEKNELF